MRNYICTNVIEKVLTCSVVVVVVVAPTSLKKC